MPADKQPRTTLADRRRQALVQLDDADVEAAKRSRATSSRTDETAGAPSSVNDAPSSVTVTRESAPAPTSSSSSSTGSSSTTRAKKTTAQIAREKGKVALGLYFPDAEDLDEARRAFVTDFWEYDGPDTFSEWISQAVLAHAARSHTERAALAQPRRARQAGVRGKLRKIDVRREISDAVEAGIAEDRQQLRRQITVSTWCNDAVTAAVSATKDRTDGELMEIDGSLPPRLKK